jgi:hypothetical protein
MAAFHNYNYYAKRNFRTIVAQELGIMNSLSI